VDGALLRAYREFASGRSIPVVKNWLVLHALDQLDRVALRVTEARERTVSIEQHLPETPPLEEVSSLGEDVIYFYHPDEDLQLEDIIPHIEVPGSEDVAETKDLQRTVEQALAELATEKPRILPLRGIQGRSREEVSKQLGKSVAEVDRTLRSSHEYLR